MTSWSYAIAALAIGACLPIHEITINDDLVQKSFEVDGPKSIPKLELRVDPTPTMLNASLANVATCERQRKELVQRWRETKKTTNSWVHGTMYALGVLASVAGVGIIADNVNNTDPARRTFPVGDTVEKGRDIGIGVTGGGAAVLLLALGSSVRAGDDRTHVGAVEREVPNSTKTIECERTPAAAVPLGLVFATTGGARVYVPLGATDPQGRISMAWAAVVAQMPITAKSDGQVVAGSAETVTATLAHGGDVVALASVTAPMNTDPEIAWQATTKADTVDGYRAYAQRFPQSAHVAEADQHAKAILARDAQGAFDAAIAADSLERATKAIELLRANAEASVVATAQERLDKLQLALRVKDARDRLPKLLADAEAAPDPALAIAQIKTAIDQLRATDPELAGRADTQLAATRTKLVARLVTEGKEAATTRDFTTATTRFASASAIADDPKPIEKARSVAFETAVRTGQAAARSLAYKKDYAQAIAIIDALVVGAPQNTSLVADRKNFVAARERAAREDVQRLARLEAADKAKAEREAAALAEREQRAAKAAADRDKAERDKAEREEKLKIERDQKVARFEAERAAKAKAEAERQERAEAAKLAAEDRRLAAIAEKARKAAEAQAKIDDAKRKADDAKRAQEEAKRNAAATKLAAQVAKAQAPNPPSTVQFTLPARHATGSVLEKLPVPTGCNVSLTAFLAKSATCKGECKPHTVSRAMMTCGALKLVFMRDQTSVWLTCEGDKQTCAECLATGRSALAPVLESREPLDVVQGCKKP